MEQDTCRLRAIQHKLRTIAAFPLAGASPVGHATMLVNQVVRNGPTIYMRVRRRLSGAAWAFTYSYDSTHWTPAFTFNLPFHP